MEQTAGIPELNYNRLEWEHCPRLEAVLVETVKTNKEQYK